MRLGHFSLCVAILLPLAAVATEPLKQSATPPPSAEAPPPPPLRGDTPTSGPADTGLEPEVTITTHGEFTHQEYRLNGKLYMIKVIPKHGKPYYLIDTDGTGQFRRSDLEPTIAIPHWVIKSW